MESNNTQEPLNTASVSIHISFGIHRADEFKSIGLQWISLELLNNCSPALAFPVSRLRS